jgi:transposase
VALDRDLPADHRARRIRTILAEFDLSELDKCYAGVGSDAYRPELLLGAALLEILEGRRSPAQWSRNARENAPMQWLLMGIQPSRTTWYDFRDRVGRVLDQIQAQVIRLADQEGFLDPERKTVQDGTVIRACASRHRLMNSTTLDRRLSVLRDYVAQDEAGFSGTPTESWPARTPGGRQDQLRRYERAREILDQRLAVNARRDADKRLPEKQVVVSASDPEAPMGRDKEKVFGPCYTAQFVVDFRSSLIVSNETMAQATDAGTLPGMLDRTQEILGEYPRQHVVDAGYVSLLDLQECARRGVELIGPIHENDFSPRKRQENPPKQLGKDDFVWLPDEQTYACPQGHRLELRQKYRIQRRDQTLVQLQYHCPPEHCRACPLADRCCRNPQAGRTVKRFEGEELLDEHRRRMETEDAQELRRLRGSIIELKFADAKGHRNLRRLHGRGLQRARTEVGLVALATNLLILDRLRSAEPKSCCDSS